MNEKDKIFSRGDLIIFAGDHCYAGKVGEFVEYRETIFGIRPVFTIPELLGHESFAMRPTNYKRCAK